ncbi:MAG: hypothetical protein RLZZ337_1593 [Bacteroidota bacterium]
MKVAIMIPCAVFNLFVLMNRKKGARLNSAASLSQGASVAVANPVFINVMKLISGN